MNEIPCKTSTKRTRLVSDIEVILNKHPNQAGSCKNIIRRVNASHTSNSLETITGLITGPILQEPKIRSSEEKCPKAMR